MRSAGLGPRGEIALVPILPGEIPLWTFSWKAGIIPSIHKEQHSFLGRKPRRYLRGGAAVQAAPSAWTPLTARSKALRRRR